MVRLQQALLACTAALGFSGCLLFTDPINKAPVVTITPETTPVTRGMPTAFTAQVTDDKDNPKFIVLHWAEFPAIDQSCASYLAAPDWTTNLALYPSSGPTTAAVPYSFTPKKLAPSICLCVQATDSAGATAQACTLPLTPDNPTPQAVITDLSAIPGAQTKHRLCSTVHLSAGQSLFPASDQREAGEVVQFTWGGTDPNGAAIQFIACSGLASDKVDDLLPCFKGAVSGNYQVTLTIKDTVTVNNAPVTKTSDLATLPIAVDVDRPACILTVDPDIYATTVVLSRSDTRVFTVSSVDDDCDPYPPTTSALQFVWSLFDPTQPTPSGQTQWVPQRDFKAVAFPVSQALFPNVRPGDIVQVRLEIRDTPTQVFYSKGQPGGAFCTPDTPICYAKDDAGKVTDCVRWTTWNVQF